MFAKTTNSLFLDLHDLQRAGVLVNTRLILDDGELSIHWFMLDLPVVDWLGEAWGDNVVILPGVSLAEAEQFVDILYGRENILSISNEHYTVIEVTGITDEFVSNNNCDNEYVKLVPIWLMKYVVTSSCTL